MAESFPVPFLPVLTQQPKVRLRWVILINLSWFVGLYNAYVMSTTLPFTLRHFTSDTRIIALIASAGLWFGIVLGPLVNYASDRIWTRFGRRRPFLIVATCGTLLAVLGLPFVPALTPLILLVVTSSILGDLGSTAEPLWLEVVPSPQRGSGFAIRSMTVSLASFLFYQLMFAQFDNVYHLPAGVTLTGEQTCYLSAAFFQATWLVFLIFLIREVRPQGVRLHQHADLRSEPLIHFVRASFGQARWWHYLLLSPLPVPLMLKLGSRPGLHWVNLLLFPIAFFVRFVGDVFMERRWWWIYLFYISGTLGASHNTFGTLMIVEQFHYAKTSIALTGVPMIILGNFLITPFMAWYADRLPRFHPLLLAGVTGGCGIGLYYFLGLWTGVPKLQLPPFWAMMVIAALGTIGPAAFIIWCFQSLKRLNPNSNVRIWAWIIGNVTTVLLAVLTYATIEIFYSDHVPSLMCWFLLMCVGTGVGCLHIVAGPLLYDFLPKDKIGTLSSGFGLLSTALNAILSTLVGVWVFYYSSLSSGGKTTKDYTTVYVMQIILGIVMLVIVFILARKLFSGEIVEYGRLGLNSDATPTVPAEPEPGT